MKKNKLYLILPAIALLAWSCGDEEQVTPKQQPHHIHHQTRMAQERFLEIVKEDASAMQKRKQLEEGGGDEGGEGETRQEEDKEESQGEA